MEDLLSGRALDLIQSSFPLEHDPYGVMAVQLGTTRDEVLAAVEELRRSGTVRRMGASFASNKLGYSSSLCALAVPGDAAEVDRVAGIVNAYPGVTHNYLRDNRFNLWFTIIARGKAEIARILAEIQEEAGCGEALNLPATKLYKIRVDFSEMNSKSVSSSCHPEPKAKGLPTPKTPATPFDPENPFDVALVRWAQEDIAGSGEAVDPEPFATAAAVIAAETGDSAIDEQRVLGRLRELKRVKAIRRFGALVAHRKMGYAFNGMTVWDVPAASANEVGKAFAAQPFVSHCYARPRSDAWPYNLYAMVHATTQEELDERVAVLEELGGMRAQVLISTREYKKTSMRYFAE